MRVNERVWLPAEEERYWEYLKSVRHVPLRPTDKLLCYGTVLTVSYCNRIRKTLGRWRRALTTLGHPPSSARPVK
jgi:hypothetical protein